MPDRRLRIVPLPELREHLKDELAKNPFLTPDADPSRQGHGEKDPPTRDEEAGGK